MAVRLLGVLAVAISFASLENTLGARWRDIVPAMLPDVPDRPRYAIPAPGVELAPIVAIALIVILNFVAPVPFLPHAVFLVIGIPLLILGVGLFGWAQVTMLRGDENPAPHKATPLIS